MIIVGLLSTKEEIIEVHAIAKIVIVEAHFTRLLQGGVK